MPSQKRKLDTPDSLIPNSHERRLEGNENDDEPPAKQDGLGDWVSDPDRRIQRFKLFLINLGTTNFSEYTDRLTLMRDDMTLVVLSLNDSPEKYRKEALLKMKPTIYRQVIVMITTISLYREKCVATDEYIDRLPRTAQKCMFCSEQFSEGSDIIWKPCGKHVFCQECWKGLAIGNKGHDLPLPFNAVCSCAGLPKMG